MEEGFFSDPTGMIFKKYYILYDVFSKENLSIFLAFFWIRKGKIMNLFCLQNQQEIKRGNCPSVFEKA